MTDALYAAGLIPQQTKEEMLVLKLTDYEKASKLVIVIEGVLKGSLDQKKYFRYVCRVLEEQGHQTLTDIANFMLSSNLHQIGECVDSDCLIVYRCFLHEQILLLTFTLMSKEWKPLEYCLKHRYTTWNGIGNINYHIYRLVSVNHTHCFEVLLGMVSLWDCLYLGYKSVLGQRNYVLRLSKYK